MIWLTVLFIVTSVLSLLIVLFKGFKEYNKKMHYDEKLKEFKNKQNNDRALFKRLFRYMKPYTMWYVLALALMGVGVALDIVSPRLIGYSLAEIGNEVIDVKKLVLYFVLGVVFELVSKGLVYFEMIILHSTGHKIILQIRRDVFIHIQSLSHRQFNEIPVGTLVTRDTSDVNVLFELYTNILVNIIKSIATLLGVIIAMFTINVKLSFITMAVVPVIAALVVTFRLILRKTHREVRTQVSNMNAFLSENISGIKTTQIFNQEKKKHAEFAEVNGRLKKASLREIFTFGIFRPSIYVLYIVILGIILYTGSNEAINSGFGALAITITYSELYVFCQYISRLFQPIQSLADQYNNMQSTFAAAEKIFTVLDIVPDIQDDPDAVEVTLTGLIEFKHVWFAYKEDDWILKDVSFTIHPKEVVAFVGATGAGKSTILGLIARNYDIQKGEILIDNVPIKKIKLECLRRQIGQMLQDVFLFSGTIADNIRLDEPSITDEDIINACEEVNATKFISKNPQGINAKVTERGNNLSQGERQLISFARTLVHKPQIMILDEATSNIDTETEKLIQDTLEKVIKNNTMIMVAHRLSTIQYANMIYVFDHGVLIEKGNHQELLHQRGRYYDLYTLQYEKNQLKAVKENV